MIAVACVALFAACQDKGEWDVPANTVSPYGNPNIVEDASKLMTIADLRKEYSTECNTQDKWAVIEKDIQIKGYVTCNDRTGNMYKEISLQDETGAISIGVNYGGLFGILPEGQEILIALKGLHIGNYRQQATIGIQYWDKNGTNCVGRMPLPIWNDHYTFTASKRMSREELDKWAGVTDALNGDKTVKAFFADCIDYDGKNFINTSLDIEKDQGRLVVLKNVTIHDGGYYDNDTENYLSGIPFVPGESAYVIRDNTKGETYSSSWTFNEMENNTKNAGAVALYTSSYADFAATKLPTGKFHVIGVVKRYKDEWEFIIRDLIDIKIVNE
jgi:hypothetical protein